MTIWLWACSAPSAKKKLSVPGDIDLVGFDDVPEASSC